MLEVVREYWLPIAVYIVFSSLASLGVTWLIAPRAKRRK